MREARECLDAVRRPWYVIQSSLVRYGLSTAYSLGIISVCFPKYGTWPTFLCLASFPVLLVYEVHLRDRTWRRLVEVEAPDLHRKVVGADNEGG